MHGNVWEWCEDTWHDSYRNAPRDGSAWLSDGKHTYRVVRGGSWNGYGSYCRSAFRLYDGSNLHFGIIGFRVVVSAGTQ